MIEHHIQRNIVNRLAFADKLKFSELQPEGLENKLFNYHLKLVIRDGLVEKTDDGLYSLTANGRHLGIRALDKQLAIVERAQPIVFLIIRQSPEPNSPYLLYKRLVHPLKDKIGFMHAGTIAGKTIEQVAQQQCLEKTGLNCDFKPLGGGFFTTYSGEDLESYVNFTLLIADSAKGELIQNHDNAEYFWQESPDFNSPDMIPNMPLLAKLYQAGETFFIEETIRLPQ